MPEVFCSYCNKYKDASDGKHITTGVGSKRRIKWKCFACISGSKGTPAERDAAGRIYSAELRAARSRRLKALNQSKRRDP